MQKDELTTDFALLKRLGQSCDGDLETGLEASLHAWIFESPIAVIFFVRQDDVVGTEEAGRRAETETGADDRDRRTLGLDGDDKAPAILVDLRPLAVTGIGGEHDPPMRRDR